MGMADITACAGHGCPKKETCYRYTCPKSEWQAYGNFWYDDRAEDGKCPWYWRLEEYELRKTTPPTSRET